METDEKIHYQVNGGLPFADYFFNSRITEANNSGYSYDGVKVESNRLKARLFGQPDELINLAGELLCLMNVRGYRGVTGMTAEINQAINEYYPQGWQGKVADWVEIKRVRQFIG
jgi:hypothetical protein